MRAALVPLAVVDVAVREGEPAVPVGPPPIGVALIPPAVRPFEDALAVSDVPAPLAGVPGPALHDCGRPPLEAALLGVDLLGVAFRALVGLLAPSQAAQGSDWPLLALAGAVGATPRVRTAGDCIDEALPEARRRAAARFPPAFLRHHPGQGAGGAGPRRPRSHPRPSERDLRPRVILRA